MSDFQTENESEPSDDDLGRAKPDLYDWHKDDDTSGVGSDDD